MFFSSSKDITNRSCGASALCALAPHPKHHREKSATQMKSFKNILLITLVTCVEMVSAEPLLKTSTSWDGGKIYYPKGEVEITSVKLKFEGGQVTNYHCHPVPTFGYVLKGNMEVETKDGKKVLLKEGEPVLEVMRTVHRGTAVGGPAEVLVFYAGAKSIPNTVFAESEAAKEYCN